MPRQWFPTLSSANLTDQGGVLDRNEESSLIAMKTFHWTSLAATGTMVSVLFSAALMMPTPSGVSVANASFPQQDFTPHQLGQRPASANILAHEAQAGADLQDFDTASGPVVGASRIHAALNYDLDAVFQGRSDVPRIALVSLPGDLARIREIDQRKAVFFKSVLPLVLQVNEQILEDRTRMRSLSASQKTGTPLRAVDRLWLAVMAARYGTPRNNIDALLNRHDVVPPSLALAQAASESAWGTSRFVREGNAMFGEWTFTDKHEGIVPSERATGKTHRVRAFSSLYESVLSYAVNLNKHRAYRDYRAMRATMRAEGRTIDGMHLAGALTSYSERGGAYVAELRAIISGNDLDLLDSARLSGANKPLI